MLRMSRLSIKLVTWSNLHSYQLFKVCDTKFITYFVSIGWLIYYMTTIFTHSLAFNINTNNRKFLKILYIIVLRIYISVDDIFSWCCVMLMILLAVYISVILMIFLAVYISNILMIFSAVCCSVILMIFSTVYISVMLMIFSAVYISVMLIFSAAYISVMLMVFSAVYISVDIFSCIY